MKFKLLESVDYMITIPTEPEDVATLLENHSYDWAVCLKFLYEIGKSQGVIVDYQKVAEIMRKKYA